MAQALTHPDQVRGLFQFLAVELEERHGFSESFSEMHFQSLLFIAEKNRDYRGQAYLEQIEKNAIYLGEASDATCQAMATFLCEGKPRLRPAAIQEYLMVDFRRSVQIAAGHHLYYVQRGCRGCPVHSRHQRWDTLFQLKRGDNNARYTEELEFECIVYQTEFLMGQVFLEVILKNHEWAKSANKLPVGVVHQILSTQLATRAELWSGLLQLNQTPIQDQSGSIVSWQKQEARPNRAWRDIWGSEYDQIFDAIKGQSREGHL